MMCACGHIGANIASLRNAVEQHHFERSEKHHCERNEQHHICEANASYRPQAIHHLKYIRLDLFAKRNLTVKKSPDRSLRMIYRGFIIRTRFRNPFQLCLRDLAFFALNTLPYFLSSYRPSLRHPEMRENRGYHCLQCRFYV